VSIELPQGEYKVIVDRDADETAAVNDIFPALLQRIRWPKADTWIWHGQSKARPIAIASLKIEVPPAK
jgi:hypothetical protein